MPAAEILADAEVPQRGASRAGIFPFGGRFHFRKGGQKRPFRFGGLAAMIRHHRDMLKGVDTFAAAKRDVIQQVIQERLVDATVFKRCQVRWLAGGVANLLGPGQFPKVERVERS